jgi:hypothetical protein
MPGHHAAGAGCHTPVIASHAAVPWRRCTQGSAGSAGNSTAVPREHRGMLHSCATRAAGDVRRSSEWLCGVVSGRAGVNGGRTLASASCPALEVKEGNSDSDSWLSSPGGGGRASAAASAPAAGHMGQSQQQATSGSHMPRGRAGAWGASADSRQAPGSGRQPSASGTGRRKHLAGSHAACSAADGQLKALAGSHSLKHLLNHVNSC